MVYQITAQRKTAARPVHGSLIRIIICKFVCMCVCLTGCFNSWTNAPRLINLAGMMHGLPRPQPCSAQVDHIMKLGAFKDAKNCVHFISIGFSIRIARSKKQQGKPTGKVILYVFLHSSRPADQFHGLSTDHRDSGSTLASSNVYNPCRSW